MSAVLPPIHARRVAAGLALLSWSLLVRSALCAAATAASLIGPAGNADDDAERLAILRELQGADDLDPDTRADLDRMAAFVERWVHDPRLYQWFDREVRRTADYDFGVAADSPLYPLTHLYRARMLIWTANEYGNIIGYHDERRKFFDRAVAELRAARAHFPENRIVRMYLGEPIPPATEYAAPPGAPAWAVAQREGLERLADLILWWIEHRLHEDGQYGGGWDDDCEMWRNWVPVLIGFEHPRVSQAQAFFSRQLLSQDYMKDGYTSHVYDVEHTTEPSSDTITPMMHLAPDDPQWSSRARRIAELMETVWTGRNERGFLQFKSTYFGAAVTDPDPVRACDTPYHVRAVEPALVLWLRTGDTRLGRLFSDWMDTWVDATAREERGKPGFLASTLVKYRLLTGQEEFDALLREDYGSAAANRIDPEDTALVGDLQETARALAINAPGRTSEVRWTDRVFAFARLFDEDMLHPEAVPACSRRPDLNLLYTTATGDRGGFLVFPLNAVRWLTPPRDIAAIVTDRAPTRFVARLYHFGGEPRPMAAELYLLEPGAYTVTLDDARGAARGQSSEFRVDGPRTRIELNLPPVTSCVLNIRRGQL